MRTTSKRAPATGKKKLPAPLANNVLKEVEAKKKRLEAQAKADVALILRRKEIITDAFLDIAAAVLRLEKIGAHKFYGKPSFAAFCEDVLEMSLTKAKELIAITRAPREQALAWGQERTAALLTLADATPEADTAESLSTAKLKLPSGKILDIAKASTKAIWEAVKEIRTASSAGKKPRGLSVSAGDRKAIAALERSLHAAKLTQAKAVAVANHHGARIRFEHVPLADVVPFAKALLAWGKTHSRE